MKRMIAMSLVLLLVFAAGCSAQQKAAPEESTVPADTPEQSAQVGLANPWTEYDNLADAEAAAGFDFPQPDWADDYDSVVYRVTDGIIEVIYEQDNGQSVTLRKGADETDISGDYGDYHFTEVHDGITVMGEADTQDTDKLCKSATWTADGHFYAIWFDQPVKMDEIIETAKLVTTPEA